MPISNYLVFFGILLVAAVLEVAGDYVIRQGFKTNAWIIKIIGMIILCFYGFAVNLVGGYGSIAERVSKLTGRGKLNFADLLGIYVVAFASVSVLWGCLIENNRVSTTTLLGIAIIIIGGIIINYGS